MESESGLDGKRPLKVIHGQGQLPPSQAAPMPVQPCPLPGMGHLMLLWTTRWRWKWVGTILLPGGLLSAGDVG